MGSATSNWRFDREECAGVFIIEQQISEVISNVVSAVMPSAGKLRANVHDIDP